MSEVTKIATRVSYGNALVELAKEHDDVYVLDADLAAATQTAIFKKEFPERHMLQQVLLQQERFRLQVRLPCLQQDVHSSRCETRSVIRT